MTDELPEDVLDRAEELTRLARQAVDDAEAAAYREERERLLAEHDYTARVREDDRAVLVCHPAEWVEDGTVVPERVEDIDRGVERPLEGPGVGAEWEVVAEHNDEVVQQVAAEHGEVHGANARALADFCSNHYAKPIETATDEELDEFVEEYFPRNAWPSDDQTAVVEESVRLTVAVATELRR
jgi:hypothetical protein